MQDETTEEKVRQKAFALWKDEGQPHGRDLEHWIKATAIVAARETAGPDHPSVPPSPSPATTTAPEIPRVPQKLRGHIDVADRSRIAGWVQDVANPGRRLTVVLTLDGVEIDRMEASILRQDLAKARIGDGRHSYQFSLGGQTIPKGLHVFDLVDAATDAAIPGDRRKLVALARLFA